MDQKCRFNIELLTLDEIKSLDVNSLTPFEIQVLKDYAFKCRTNEQGIKQTIVSIYGAFGNKFFHWIESAIAESVTLQGQDAIKYTEKMIEKYFQEFFHKDKQLHKLLGVPDDYVVPKLKEQIAVYMDTDSIYMKFDEVISAINWQGNSVECVLALNEHRLAKYIQKILADYAAKYGTENYLDFELETIAYNGIWVAKKRYAQNLAWKDGVNFKPLTKIKTTGLEINQSSTPAYCRQRLMDVLKYIFGAKQFSNENYSDFVKLVKDIKREFKLSSMENISMGRGISDYNKYILNDTNQLELAFKCPAHVRAAGYYNYLLNQHPKLKDKYEIIKSGDKVKYYYTVNSKKNCDLFAYKAGSWPHEFAPAMDIEKQFNNTVIVPLNRILDAAKVQLLNSALAYTAGALY